MEAVHHVALSVGTARRRLARVGWGAAGHSGRVADKLRKTEANWLATDNPTARVGTTGVRVAVLSFRDCG